ncbi:glutamate racemase [Citricoccus nitrophenolicus]|uniref:Glutamate racemase n=1 Tax=Citricoccus muralis TaxID=169134 RepID=A0A3D9L9B4_9MICC|nr:glutamate racemase [Citricoccus muralis]REE02692.1 glutamate racemase [Citricoccus muralis]
MTNTPVPTAPIGVFDSGVGGLTVARAIIDQLPGEQIAYVGDTANGPYGPRTIAQVRAFALGIMDELVDAGVKVLVIACNSASAAVLRDARERYTARYGIPVVEVIQPAVRRAVAATRNGRIGVIGTEATVSSRAYEDTFAAAPQLEITSVACPRFVEFVEAGVTTGPELLATAERYLAPLREAGVDTLVLGCTHYPLLTGVISLVMGESVTLVSSAEETAKDVYRALVRHGLESPADGAAGGSAGKPGHRFMATGDPQYFETLARRFLGPEVGGVQQVDHISERYPTGVLARITPEMLSAAQGATGQGATRQSANGHGTNGQYSGPNAGSPLPASSASSSGHRGIATDERPDAG